MIDFKRTFESALEYGAYLEVHGSPDDRNRWDEVFRHFALDPRQKAGLAGFVRQMNVLCLAGAWCGDCVDQCPVLQHFAQSSPRINLRFVDRDADKELASALQVCGGGRVPVVVFLSEDYAECGRYGDRTLSRYRALAVAQGMIPPGNDPDEGDPSLALAADWLREFERIQLMLRLSPRLRRIHGD